VCNYVYVKLHGIDMFICLNSWLLLLISCFHDFYLFECEPWIDEWLLLKHVEIHFINVYICLYVDVFWIGVVVCEVWMKNAKNVSFGEKLT